MWKVILFDVFYLSRYVWPVKMPPILGEGTKIYGLVCVDAKQIPDLRYSTAYNGRLLWVLCGTCLKMYAWTNFFLNERSKNMTGAHRFNRVDSGVEIVSRIVRLL